MIHTSITLNCVVFLLPCRLTQSAIYGSQIFDSHKWPTMLVRKVKRKPRSFKANLGGSLYSTLNHLSNHAFYNKWLQTRPIQGNGSAGQMSVETHEDQSEFIPSGPAV